MNKNRFLQVLRWQLLLSKRQIITMMLAFFGLLVIPQMIMLILKPVSDSAFSMTMFSIVFFLVYIVTCGAGIFTNLKTRQQRINDFMLPASNLEKFISRYLVLIIAIPLAAIVGFLAGDLVQHLLVMAFGKAPAGWAVSYAAESMPQLWNFNNPVKEYDDVNSFAFGPWMFIMAVIFQHAVFLFFGSIYHKHPIVMAVLSWMVLGMVVLTLLGLGAKLFFDFIDEGYTIILYDNWWIALYFIVAIILSALCYWFAYRRYARLQVINNQWINK